MPGLACVGHFAIAAGGEGAGHEGACSLFKLGDASEGDDEATKHPLVLTHLAAVIGFDGGTHVEFGRREKACVIDEVGEETSHAGCWHARW